MSDHFNGLTPAEQERLALLAEECAEVIHIVNKIWRHGYHSTNPTIHDGPNNQEMLESEIGHVYAAVQMMVDANDLSGAEIAGACKEKPRLLKKYLHHQ